MAVQTTQSSITKSAPSSVGAVGDDKPWALKSLPPFPAVALQLLSLLDDETVPMRQVVNLLRVDPALSAEILRVSNSALYGLSRRIDNISHAIVVLGTDSVKRLALTVALGRFSHGFMRDKGLRICWDHSVACALLCEELSDTLHQARDRAYTIGLLHDVGRLAILACYPKEYGNMLEVARENDFDELECERQLFDIDHAAAGQWLAQHWNLPSDFAEAISSHRGAPYAEGTLRGMVSSADALTNAMGFGVLQTAGQPTIAEIIDQLPFQDKAKAVEHYGAMAAKIRSTMGAISPS